MFPLWWGLLRLVKSRCHWNQRTNCCHCWTSDHFSAKQKEGNIYTMTRIDKLSPKNIIIMQMGVIFVSFIQFFIFGFWSLLATNLRKYFVYILEGKMGKTEKRQKEKHATKVTKIPKTKRRKFGMNETLIYILCLHWFVNFLPNKLSDS